MCLGLHLATNISADQSLRRKNQRRRPSTIHQTPDFGTGNHGKNRG